MKLEILLLLALFLFPAQAFAADKEVLAEVYTLTTRNYVEPVSVEKIAVLTLKALNSVDKNITIADDNKRISIYKNAAIVKSYIKPAPNNVKQWANLSEKILKETKKLSPALARKDFELVDLILKEAFTNFDRGSKYYAALTPDAASKHLRIKNLRGDILYIKIKDFNASLKQNIKDSIHPYTQSLILDLRGNSGGQLSGAVEVAKLFLDGGIIASSKGRKDQATSFYLSEEEDVLSGRPIIVLVDANTASAAEVLAASLQEQGRAKVVGTNTFAKGTIQTVYPLSNDSYLALSTAYLYTPSNRKLDGAGVLPDSCTSDIIKVNDTSVCPAQAREQNQDDIDTALEMLKE